VTCAAFLPVTSCAPPAASWPMTFWHWIVFFWAVHYHKRRDIQRQTVATRRLWLPILYEKTSGSQQVGLLEVCRAKWSQLLSSDCSSTWRPFSARHPPAHPPTTCRTPDCAYCCDKGTLMTVHYQNELAFTLIFAVLLGCHLMVRVTGRYWFYSLAEMCGGRSNNAHT